MRIAGLVTVIFITLIVTEGLKPGKLGKPGKKSKKTLRIVGEAGLGAASLTAAMGILNSIERSLQPDDLEMKQLIEGERKRLLGLASNIWNTPWPYSGGMAGLMMIALVLYVIRMLKRRNSREQTEAGDHGSTRIVVGRPRKETEREEKRKDEECIQIGDIQFPMKE